MARYDRIIRADAHRSQILHTNRNYQHILRLHTKSHDILICMYSVAMLLDTLQQIPRGIASPKAVLCILRTFQKGSGRATKLEGCCSSFERASMYSDTDMGFSSEEAYCRWTISELSVAIYYGLSKEAVWEMSRSLSIRVEYSTF